MMEIEEEEAVPVNSSRLKSVVWNDFDRLKKGDSYIAVCRLCKRILNGSSTSGTSHLRNHLIRCRKKSNHDITQLLTRGKRNQSTLSVTNLSYTPVQVKNEVVTVASTDPCQRQKVARMNFGDQKLTQLDLARMIILHGYPLSMVEDVGFKTFVRSLQPLFNVVGVSEIVADCKEIYFKEKQKVYEELDKLPGKISLSAEKWVTNGGNVYFCLRAHYVDDSWEIRKKILSFSAVDLSQAEEMLAEVIMKSLSNWKIDRKLFSLTIDNRSSYDKVVSRTREHLCQSRSLMIEGQLFDLRCVASTVKLLVQDVLESSREMIDRVRESIRFVKSSKKIQEKFDEIVQLIGINCRKGLSLDSPLQWNSTYLMVETALEYREAFPLLQEFYPNFSTSPFGLDWDRLRAITGMLKFFYEVSSKFADGKNLTASFYFSEVCDIHVQLIEWCHKSDEFIISLALKLKSRFDEYWKKCSLIMAIAAILDPRYKMKLVEYYYLQIYGPDAPSCIDIVSNCLKALHNSHAINSPLVDRGQSSASESNGNDVKDRLVGYDRYVNENSFGQNTKSDLVKYLEEPVFPKSADFSILDWWKIYETRYPVLSMMARNILGIPISKASPESLFETGDRTFTHCWSSLNWDILEGLLCSQDWMRTEWKITDSNISMAPTFPQSCDAKE